MRLFGQFVLGFAIFVAGYVAGEHDRSNTATLLVVHTFGQPLAPSDLPSWTPQRVEERFDSGLTLVSSLGPHGTFQYVVRDLDLTDGAVFRVVDGTVVTTL